MGTKDTEIRQANVKDKMRMILADEPPAKPEPTIGTAYLSTRQDNGSLAIANKALHG